MGAAERQTVPLDALGPVRYEGTTFVRNPNQHARHAEEGGERRREQPREGQGDSVRDQVKKRVAFY
jgi:hypothetical protein